MPAPAQEVQPEIRHDHSADQGGGRGLEDVVANPRHGAEPEQRPDTDDRCQTPEPDGQP
jgi:hypothetical protein